MVKAECCSSRNFVYKPPSTPLKVIGITRHARNITLVHPIHSVFYDALLDAVRTFTPYLFHIFIMSTYSLTIKIPNPDVVKGVSTLKSTVIPAGIWKPFLISPL